MTRDEAIELLMKTADELKSEIVDELIPKATKEEYIDLVEALERLKEPITLADFLGWEEDVEYADDEEVVMKVFKDNIYYMDSIEKLWRKWDNFMDDLYSLRQAKKVEPKKYYAKIKGWELNSRGVVYWGLYKEINLLFTSDNTYESNEIQKAMTKTEWAELGINDRNADFEEVE